MTEKKNTILPTSKISINAKIFRLEKISRTKLFTTECKSFCIYSKFFSFISPKTLAFVSYLDMILFSLDFFLIHDNNEMIIRCHVIKRGKKCVVKIGIFKCKNITTFCRHTKKIIKQ